MKQWLMAGVTSLIALGCASAAPANTTLTGRNVIIFVADGLRYDSVTPETGPTFLKVRHEGVDFTSSHSAYPTLTTVNAAVIATGHMPGDTGNYANSFYTGFQVKCADDAPLAFVEDNCILRDIKSHFPNDYIAQTTLLEAARKAGINTVLVGKKGPLAIQYLPALDSKNDDIAGPVGIFIDEATNKSPHSPTLNGTLAEDIKKATGLAAPADVSTPNLAQQAYQQNAVTQVLLPRLKQAGKPFAMLYWSRDPDATQHGAADSEGKLVPGINSTSDRSAIYNADRDLKGILDALKFQGLDGNTDVIVVADHGFSTIGKGIPSADGEIKNSTLPSGFLAVDVAGWLGGKIFDPMRANAEVDLQSGEHPTGYALIGDSADKPEAILVSNGNTEFIYIPEGPNRRAIAAKLIAKLAGADYTGGLFINDAMIDGKPEDFGGAVPMSKINMIGSSKVPQPTIVLALRSFTAKGCTLGELLCAVELSDTSLATGHGNHGSFSRADTRNFMAAIGPDFRAGAKIASPVGNSDVAPTAAKLLGISLTGPGTLTGRVWDEALLNGKPVKTEHETIISPNSVNGLKTVVKVQKVGTTRYLDVGGVPGRVVGLPAE